MSDRRLTALQGQYPAFIHYYAKVNGRPPAEADMQRYFGVTAPVVHQMVKMLDSKGLIARESGRARSIRVLVPRGQVPDLA